MYGLIELWSDFWCSPIAVTSSLTAQDQASRNHMFIIISRENLECTARSNSKGNAPYTHKELDRSVTKYTVENAVDQRLGAFSFAMFFLTFIWKTSPDQLGGDNGLCVALQNLVALDLVIRQRVQLRSLPMSRRKYFASHSTSPLRHILRVLLFLQVLAATLIIAALLVISKRPRVRKMFPCLYAVELSAS